MPLRALLALSMAMVRKHARGCHAPELETKRSTEECCALLSPLPRTLTCAPVRQSGACREGFSARARARAAAPRKPAAAVRAARC